jgi:nitrate reductase gamma subunit
MTSHLQFAVWPYVALALLGGGLGLRVWLAPGAVPPAAPDRRWPISLLLLAAAHLLALLFPRWITAWNASAGRLYLLEGAGLAIGVVATAGWLRLVAQRLRSCQTGDRSLSRWVHEIADSMFLSLFLLALLSGVLTALFHRWGSSWGVATLTPYGRSLLAGEPQDAYPAALPFVVRLHVTATFGALAAFPWSRPGELLALALRRALTIRVPAAPAAAIKAWLGRHAGLLWPEEDARDLPYRDDNAVARPATAEESARLPPGDAFPSRSWP